MNKKYMYFTIDDLCKSNTANRLGIKNIPNSEQLNNLEALIINLLDPARALYGKHIIVSNGFRCEELNKNTGEINSSNHLSGCAVDIVCDYPDRLYEIIKGLKDFDELFFETNNESGCLKTRIHVAFRKNKNRKKQGKINNGIFTWKNF